MKKKNIELDVGFIGGHEPLTKEEEKGISDFIRADKEKRRLKENRKRELLKRNQNNQLRNDKKRLHRI